MLINYDMLCMGCMSMLGNDGSCKKCLYENNMPDNPQYLSPKSTLAGRYIVGKVHHKNCEGPLYIGFDTAENVKVWIKEYFPEAFASRNLNDKSVYSKADKNVQFKSYKSDFEEVSSTIKNLAVKDNIIPVTDIVYQNNTVYAIYKYIPCVSFKEYLAKSYGELSWAKAKKIFMPFCTAVSNLHKLGFIHRGISPETVFVDEDDNLLLFGFAIPSTRTQGQMKAEMFDGYCAPEQYQSNGWQGEWTDVYAVSAMLYKALTGTMPPDALSRNLHDNLVPVDQLNKYIPENVSNAIVNGMVINSENRINTIDRLTADLLESTGTNTAVFDAESAMAARKSNDKKQSKESYKRSRSPIYITLTTAITILILFGICWGVMVSYFPELLGKVSSSSEISSSSQEETSSSEPPVSAVPSFEGKYIDTIYENPEYAAKYYFNVTEQYNDQYPEGIVVSQTVTERQEAQDDIVVNLIVSMGPRVVPMPNLVGSKIKYAMKTLTDLKIDYEIFEVVDETLTEGYVSKTSISAGELIVRERDKVFLYTKKNVPPPPPPSSSSSSSSSPSSKSSKSSSSSSSSESSDEYSD